MTGPGGALGPAFLTACPALPCFGRAVGTGETAMEIMDTWMELKPWFGSKGVHSESVSGKWGGLQRLEP